VQRREKARKRRQEKQATMQEIIRVICKWPRDIGPTKKIETLSLFAINELTGFSINL
jgi:hypothetical protein